MTLLLWKAVLVVLLSASPARASTLDLTEVVMRGPPADRQNDEDDHFGYSAALHNKMQFSGASTFSDIVESARILVGVPKGTATNATVDRTGYVLECPLKPGPCTGLRGSMTREDRRLYDMDANDDNEDKTDQLMGVAMESRNGQFAVCAHKWSYNNENNILRTQGQCLLSGRSLEGFTLVRPCTPEGTVNQRITETNTWRYCSSGVSTSFLPSSQLIIGSAGAGDWSGSNFAYNGTSVVPTTNTLSTAYSLAGYSVAPVRVSSPTAQEWVTGAPRANEYVGQVHVLALQLETASATRPVIRNPLITISGTKFGSYFGYSVAGVDFNGDGYDEVLVGAPLYFQSSNVPEEGIVYIYRNQVTQNTGSLDSNIFTELTAPGEAVAYSRFGHAIAPLGDLDDDGFDDVAISAPFGQGLSGTVYIYRGSRQGIITTPAQTLKPDSLNLMPSAVAGLTSFGAFLSSTTDIDGNQYNDLVIGSFASRRVFVVRSRTVVVVTTSVTPTPSSVVISGSRNCSLDNSLNNCFQVQYCTSVRGRGLTNGQAINISYTVYADNRPSGLTARAQFSTGGTTMKTGQFMPTAGGPPDCVTEILYVMSGTPQELQDAPLNPSMTVSVVQGALTPMNDGNVQPTDLSLNRYFGRVEGTLSASVIGLDECLMACTADVSISSNAVQYISRSNASFSEQFILEGVVSDLVFRTTISNAGPNTAYSLMLRFTHPTALAYSRVEDGARFTCETDQSRTVTSCTVTNALASSGQMEVAIRFVILSGIVGRSVASLSVNAVALTSSDDPTPMNNAYNFSLPVRASVSPTVTGSVSPDQLDIIQDFSRDGLPTSLVEIGREISVNFTVTNNGPSAIGQGRLTIYLPYRNPCTVNGFLFYITSVSVANLQNGICTASPMDSINVLQLTLPSSGGQGGEEVANGTDTSTTMGGAAPTLDDIPGTCNTEGGQTQTVRCAEGVQGCVVLTCLINSQRNGYRGQISITGYIDDNYYQDTSTHHTLYFNAQYQVLDSNSFTEESTQDSSAEVSLSLLNPSVVGASVIVPAWVVALVSVVAILLALIAIAITIAVLYKCGFFKRGKTKEQLLQEQQQKDNGVNGSESLGNTTTENS